MHYWKYLQRSTVAVTMVSVRKHHTLGGGTECTCGGDHKCQNAYCNCRSKGFKAFDASVFSLSQDVNIIAVHMCAKQGNDDDAKHATDAKIGANTKNPMLKISKYAEEMMPETIYQ